MIIYHPHTGDPLIISAAKKGKYSFIKEMLELDFDVDAVDSQGKTALMYAIERNDTKIIRLLENYGAKKQESSFEPDEFLLDLNLISPENFRENINSPETLEELQNFMDELAQKTTEQMRKFVETRQGKRHNNFDKVSKVSGTQSNIQIPYEIEDKIVKSDIEPTPVDNKEDTFIFHFTSRKFINQINQGKRHNNFEKISEVSGTQSNIQIPSEMEDKIVKSDIDPLPVVDKKFI
ncbi:ankyrin repeat domain-containing protein, partial [Bacillus cereus group sp. MYBK58-1]